MFILLRNLSAKLKHNCIQQKDPVLYSECLQVRDHRFVETRNQTCMPTYSLGSVVDKQKNGMTVCLHTCAICLMDMWGHICAEVCMWRSEYNTQCQSLPSTCVTGSLFVSPQPEMPGFQGFSYSSTHLTIGVLGLQKPLSISTWVLRIHTQAFACVCQALYTLIHVCDTCILYSSSR